MTRMISKVDIKLPSNAEERKIKGYADITIMGCCVVHGLKIIEANNGLFVGMPNRKDSLGAYRDIFHPITKEFRSMLQETVLAAYYDALANPDNYRLAADQEAELEERTEDE